MITPTTAAAPNPIRVIVADDEQLVRAALVKMVNSRPDMTVVAEAGNGPQAVRCAQTQRADVVLMDVRMPGGDGIEATGQLRSLPTPPQVLVLTTFDLDDYVFAALEAGASGFLLKDTDPERLFHAIRMVAAGEGMLAPSVTRRLIERHPPACGRVQGQHGGRPARAPHDAGGGGPSMPSRRG
ncbi:response regulator [Arthrobacter psychrolactophilus]